MTPEINKGAKVSIPKRQHFIPRMYLKHFVGQQPAGQIWTYDIEKGTSRSLTPKKVAVATHFYSFEDKNGKLDTRIESLLSTVESTAAPIYEEMLLGSLPKDGTQKKMDFTNFLSSMHVRHPAMRKRGTEIYGRIIEK